MPEGVTIDNSFVEIPPAIRQAYKTVVMNVGKRSVHLRLRWKTHQKQIAAVLEDRDLSE